MKILDKKGNLFGLINIVDLAIIIIIVLTLIFGAKRYFLKPDESKMMKDAKLTFEISDVRDITIETINVGDQLYWSDRNTPLGEIIEVNHIPYEQALEQDGEWVNMPVPGKYAVTFTIEAKVKDDGDAFWLSGEQVRVGIKYMVKTKYINLEAHIIGFDIDE